MKVIATQKGFFNGSIVEKGEIFYIKPKDGKRSPDKGLTDFLDDIYITEEQQLGRWMKVLDEPENPEADQAHNYALREFHSKADNVIRSSASDSISETKADSSQTVTSDVNAEKDQEEVI